MDLPRPSFAHAAIPGNSGMLTNLPCGHPILVMFVTAADADRLAAGQTIYSANDGNGQTLGVHLVLMGGENNEEIHARLLDMAPRLVEAAHFEHHGP